jgi:DNA-binding CsgD family transcriptional regulator
VTYSLSVWRDRPEIEHPHPSLTREEKIAYYSAQNVPQKKIGEYLSISSSRVSQLYQEYKCTKS